MNFAGVKQIMRTVDAEAAPEASEELRKEYERRLDPSEGEDPAHDWRSWRADEFRRHQRIDRIGTLTAVLLGALLLSAALCGLHGH